MLLIEDQLIITMASEHTIYVSSSACADIYDDKIDRFTNRLSNPITLNPHIEYEMGLVSMLYPSQYYAIANGGARISLHSHIKLPHGKSKIHIHQYRCSKNILAGDMENIISILNEDLIKEARVYFDLHYKKYIKNNTVIYWNEKEKRTMLKYVKGTSFQNGEVMKISVKMSYELSKLLGFRSDVEYTIYGKQDNTDIRALYASLPSCGMDYIYVYCDIIHPSPFGGQLVNILDCFTFQNGFTKGIHNTVYKSIKISFIDEIAIILTNQNGEGIHFMEGSSITCVLHIRPK